MRYDSRSKNQQPLLAGSVTPKASSPGKITTEKQSEHITQPIIQDSLVKPKHLTQEEKELLGKGQHIEMIGGQKEHSGHMISRLRGVGSKVDKTSVCFVFGMEDIEPAQGEGKSMAQAHYTRAQAEQFLFAEGWDKYHDRFFTRYYVQEGLNAYAKARAGGEEQAEAHEHNFVFNPNLPADAVEIAPSEKPSPGEFYEIPPAKRPANIPNNYSLTRVFQGKAFLGWVYQPREFVAALHKSAEATGSERPHARP